MAALRACLKKHFLTNTLSAAQTQNLARATVFAGARGVEDFAKAAGGGQHPKNAHRDLMRAMLKGAVPPDPYFASVPVHCKQTNQRQLADMAFMLPHEVLCQLVEKNGSCRDFQPVEGHLLEEVRRWATTMGVPADVVIPLGLHGDGVPFAAKMRDSLEQFSWNCAAHPGAS